MGLFDGILGLVTNPISTIVSGAISGIGQSKTNDANRDINQDNNAFNAEQAALTRGFNSAEANTTREWGADQAQKQMDFQKEMSNTQYQRAVGDMSKAGLNPMLAYTQGGAGNLSGAQASGGQASGGQASASSSPTMLNKAAAAMQSAQGAAAIQQMQAQTRVADTQADLNKATAIKTEADTNYTTTNTRTADARTDQIRTEIDLLKETINNAQLEGRNKGQEYKIKQAQESLMKVDQMLRLGQIDKTEAETALTKTRKELYGLDIEIARPEAKKAQGTWGGNVSPYLSDIGKIINSAVGAARIGR